MRRYKSSIIMGLLGLLASTIVLAQEPLKPLQIEARYDGSYGLLALGRVRVTIDENPPHYHIQLDTKSRGLAAWFSDMKSVATADGIVHDGSYIPQDYEATSLRKSATIGLKQSILYKPDGSIQTRNREPMDDVNWRPIVPLDEASQAVDPITAYLVLRPKLKEMLEKNLKDTNVHTYDGARLAEMKFHFVRHTNIEMMDKNIAVIDTTIQRQIIAGYTPKERKKFESGDPEIHLYFTDDARLLPVKITVDLGLGELSIELAELIEK